MNFHDPTRTRLANWRPCWLNSTIALPPLQLEPHPTDPALICLTICHGSRGIWLEKDIPLAELHKTIHYWSEDPEGTFMALFGLESWPKEVKHTRPQPSQQKVSVPIEELI